ncbi:hypothetical protein EVJ58_g453 [Rhodofomes roseus]|uniref:CHAT domain-containing protein n=1 Tax=Rhodofomes roseus TaxID=34475 RepID=A0A4Y9Z4D5_9APHY|nr:hypothetical protein EVJ58_g453 [Rhodofomes roseus]
MWSIARSGDPPPLISRRIRGSVPYREEDNHITNSSIVQHGSIAPAYRSSRPNGTTSVVALIAEGNEALRTEALTRQSTLAWNLKTGIIRIRPGSGAFRLEVKYRTAETGPESSLGYVDLTSDELLARCLQGDTTASFDVTTGCDDPKAELKLDFFLLEDESFEAGLPGSVLGSNGPATDLDQEYNVASRLRDTDPDKWLTLMDISTRYYERFRAFGDTLSLAKALPTFGEAIGIVLDRAPPRSDQHQLLRDKTELYVTAMTEFVAAFREYNADAINCLSDMLTGSTAMYILLYDRFGDRGDLSRAIDLCVQAKSIVPEDHPDTPIHLRRWGMANMLQFRFSGEVEDINESITALERSVRLTSESDIDLPDRLTNLGTSYVLRAEYSRNLKDVSKAIAAHTRALTFREDYTLLFNLGTAVLLRFMFQRDLTDAEAAVMTLERVVDLVPDGHPELRRCLGNLGVAYHNRFEVLHNIEDIDRAVTTLQRAVRALDSTGDDAPERALHVASLGNAYLCRADILLEDNDMHLAVETLKRAVELTPTGLAHLQKRRHNLGRAYATRYERHHDPADVDRAMVEFEASLGLLPDGHADRPGGLSMLAGALQARFGLKSDMDDINRAISLSLSALNALNPEDYRRRSVVSILAASYVHRFSVTQDADDLDEAVHRYREAMDSTPADAENPLRQCAAIQLAHTLKRRFDFKNSADDLDAAIENYRIAATMLNGVPWTSFLAAKDWARAARSRGEDGHAVALQAYGTAVELLPRVGWIGKSIANRHAQLAAMGSSLTTEAVAAAVAQGEHCLAIEWLDQARAIVWGQQSKLRSSFDDLRAVAPALAAKLDRVSRALDTAGSRDAAPTTDFLGTARLEEAAEEDRRTASEWQKWKTLLGHLTSLSDVLDSVGAQMEVVTDTESPAQDQRRRAEEWDRLMAQARAIPGFEDFLRPRTFAQIKEALDRSPVVIVNTDQLQCDALVLIEGLDDVIHIPLDSFSLDHAQRLHRGLSHLLSASNLRRRTTRAAKMISTDSSVASVENVLAELWQRVVKPILDSLAFSDEDGDVQAVLDNLSGYGWVHFACHGVQDIQEPTKSRFELHDGPLALLELISASFERADFAFLSACQTAMGTDMLPDEAAHLAAGMLAAGFKSIIGTMWSIQDEVAPIVAEQVYRRLLSGSVQPDSSQAAVALHHAVQMLRKQDDTKTFSWVPFVHVGW